MKASEKTNEELADNIELHAAIANCNCDVCLMFREAAARLRNVTVRTDNRAVIVELLRRLNVAEDALAKLQDRFVSSVHDGTIDPYEALKIAEDAIAAIREEGGSKINAKCVACPVKANCSGCPRGEYCDESNCPKMQGGAS